MFLSEYEPLDVVEAATDSSGSRIQEIFMGLIKHKALLGCDLARNVYSVGTVDDQLLIELGSIDPDTKKVAPRIRSNNLGEVSDSSASVVHICNDCPAKDWCKKTHVVIELSNPSDENKYSAGILIEP